MGIGAALHDHGKFDDALQSYSKGLAIQKKHDGPDHHSVGVANFNLALVAEEMGNVFEALKFAEEARRIFGAAVGLSHTDTDATEQLLTRLKNV